MHQISLLTAFSLAPALAIALSFVVSPGARGDVDWTKYEQNFRITFSGYHGMSTLTDFPVLVRLSPQLNGFDYSKCKVPGGGDLRFEDSEGRLLSSEVDTWDPNGTSFVWVKVPELTHETEITAHYGCATPDLITSSDVWSNGYVGVWHLGENALPLAESSGVSPAFSTSNGSGFTLGQPGNVGRAVDFTSASNGAWLKADDDDAFDGFSNFTIEVWTKQAEVPSRNAFILSKREGGSADVDYFLYSIKDTGRGIFCTSTTGNTSVTVVGSTYNMQPTWGEWCYQTYVRDVSDAKVYAYLNGTRKGSPAISDTADIHAGDSPLILGNSQASGVNAFTGLIDEVRISNVARTEDWVRASHDTIASANFAIYSVENTSAETDWTRYSHKFTITFSGYAGDAPLTDFPVLVRIAEFDEDTQTGLPGFRYADCRNPDGGDLRFVSANDSILPCEVDTWNTNGESLVWVKIPFLTPSTAITAYYGCALPEFVASSDVWDDDYVGVWHLGESSLPMAESTGVSTEFSSSNGTGIQFAQPGPVGGAVDFSSANSAAWLKADDDDDLDGFSNFTIEAWTKQEEAPPANASWFVLSKRGSSSSQVSYYVYSVQNTGRGILCTSTSGGGAATVYGSGGNMQPTLGEWCHQAYVRNVSDAKVYGYMNGVRKGALGISDTANIYAGTAPLILGNNQTTGSNRLIGQIDEVRISKTARSQNWLQATHDTIANPDFATYTKAIPTARRMIIYFR